MKKLIPLMSGIVLGAMTVLADEEGAAVNKGAAKYWYLMQQQAQATNKVTWIVLIVIGILVFVYWDKIKGWFV